MNVTILVLGAVIALAAAVRSTWSPCGHSMLSQITPVSEPARGNRYRRTALWYLLGGVVGGATLGGAMAVLAGAVDALDPGATPLLALAAAAAVAGAVVDSGVLGISPPFVLRQVNELWLTRYRAWVYGLGFGWQIGSGITTYVMTAAVFVTIVFGALGASSLAALALGAGFGFARGLAVFATARVRTRDELVALHRRFDALGEPVRVAVIAVQAMVAVVAIGAAIGGAAGAALATVVAASGVAIALGVARWRTPSTA